MHFVLSAQEGFGWIGLSSGAVSIDDARALHRAGRLDEALAAYRELTADPSTRATTRPSETRSPSRSK